MAEGSDQRSACPESVLMIPGMGGHDVWNPCSPSPESMLTLARNRRSAWTGIRMRGQYLEVALAARPCRDDR